MDILERVRKVIEYKAVTPSKFASLIGFNQSNLSKILRRDREVNSNLTDAILSSFPEVSSLWLKKGEGSMLIDSSGTTTVTDSSTQDITTEATTDTITTDTIADTTASLVATGNATQSIGGDVNISNVSNVSTVSPSPPPSMTAQQCASCAELAVMRERISGLEKENGLLREHNAILKELLKPQK